MFDSDNFTNNLVVGFVGIAMVASIVVGQHELAMAFGTGLLGYVGATVKSDKNKLNKQ